MDDNKFKHTIRKTKIICTAGPACWSETMLGTVFISRHWDTLTAWTFASCLGNPARVEHHHISVQLSALSLFITRFF